MFLQSRISEHLNCYEKSINRVFPFNASIQAIVRKVSRILTDSETSGEKTAEPAVGMDS